MYEFVDQLERKISLGSLPQKIVSLVPSQTELLYDLGLRDEVAGITKFCIHPDEWHKTKPHIGGTKKINIEKIHRLNPDLVIGNKEENDQSQVEELMKHYPVWMSNIKNLEDALEMIESIGNITGKKGNAIELKDKIKEKFAVLNTQYAMPGINHSIPTTQYPTVYLIWNKPLMTVGADTFIHDMLSRSGFKNLFDDRNRYPEINEEELRAAKPALILLSSEPYPFKEKHVAEFRNACPGAKVLLVDGELFSWYGSRLLKAPDYFHHLVEQIMACD